MFILGKKTRGFIIILCCSVYNMISTVGAAGAESQER